MLSVEVVTQPNATDQRDPVELIVGQRRIRVARVYDRWFGEGYHYVKFLGADGAIYVIRHDDASGAWELTFFERRPMARDEIFSAAVRSVPDGEMLRPL